MVSTRRTATTDSEPISTTAAGQALKKKPVRKATAKLEPAKTRSTRTRKPDASHESELAAVEKAEDVEVAPQVSIPQVAVSKTSSKAKKSKATPTIPPPSEAQPVEPVKAIRSTRAVQSRSKKATVHIEQQAEAPAKATVQPPPIRSTRQTRGTTGGPTPLSPKKVSQISKGRSQDRELGRDQDEKPKSRRNIAKTRVTTRARNVSDENIHPEESQESDDEIIVKSSHAAEASSAITGSQNTMTYPRSESSMSSRPTTPPRSPVPSLCDTQEEDVVGQENDESLDHITELCTRIEGAAQLDPSDDELAGPKTPMKRSSPGAHARYLASIQKTVRQLDRDRMTQGHSWNVSSRPKTVRPATRSNATMSAVRQSTVSPILVDASTSRTASLCQTPEAAGSTVVEDDTSPTSEDHMVEPKSVARDDVSHADDSLLLDTPYRTRRLSSISCSMHEEDSMMDCGDLESSIPDPSSGNDDKDVEMLAPTNTEPETDDEPHYLPATILEHEEIDGHASECSTIESDDTVVMTNTVDDTISPECAIEHKSPEDCPAPPNVPETLIWDNIRDDTTIPINFDKHFSGVRTFTRPDQNQYLSDTMELATSLECKSQQVQSATATSSPLGEVMEGMGEVRFPSSARARRTTLDTFNDFVDVDAGDRETDLMQMSSAAEQSQPSCEAMELAETELVEAAEKVKLRDESSLDESCMVDNDLPHYALPTMAFHARRKSLPATNMLTPIRFGARPHTSDGASLPRAATVDRQSWWARMASVQGTPIRPRSDVTLDVTRDLHNTPQSRRSSALTRFASSPVKTATPRPCSRGYPVVDGHANTVAGVRRFRTPVSTPVKRPATSHKPFAVAETPRTLSMRTRHSQVFEAQDGAEGTPRAIRTLPIAVPIAEATTPLGSARDRVSWSTVRRPHGELARTVGAPRYRTPMQSPPKRPVTVAKPATSRKVTFSTRTPTKTPLKGLGMTPGQVPMTPHPAAPLRDVVALVEVFTLEGASASAPFIALLQRLGAKAQKTWSERITHVVFKDGSPRTLQKLRQHNQEVAQTGVGHAISCVNSRWVSDCDAAGSRMPEADEEYAVDPTILPRGGSRRRKSMEPYALINVDGNVVRDRKSSLGRHSLSLARSPLKAAIAPPAHKVSNDDETLDWPSGGDVGVDDQENTDVELDDPALSSPATPAWLHPEQLVQQTAPLQRIRKFELKGTKPVKRRRLTFWVNDA